MTRVAHGTEDNEKERQLSRSLSFYFSRHVLFCFRRSLRFSFQGAKFFPKKNGSDFAGIPVSSISVKANVASVFAVDDAEK